MPNRQPIGRAGKNLCARGQNWAGLSQGMNFRAGLGGPKNITISIWAGWAAHFLMGFSFDVKPLGGKRAELASIDGRFRLGAGDCKCKVRLGFVLGWCVLVDLPVLRRISPCHPGCMQLNGVLGAGVLQILVV